MTGFHWHDHHFLNHHAALDFANMVVWRNRPERREDRGQSLENLKNWAAYAGLAAPSSSVAECMMVRETIDGYFRAGAGWPALIALYAETLKDGRDPFLHTILHAAVGLAFSPEMQRVRICGNCGWLFIDRTRNANKRWCTAGICGSRTKARRHYAKKRARAPNHVSPSNPPSKI